MLLVLSPRSALPVCVSATSQLHHICHRAAVPLSPLPPCLRLSLPTLILSPSSLCSCGKTTLMRAIANGQLEGFPTPAELKRFYVESSIPAHLEAATCVEYVLLDPLVRESFGLPAMPSAAPTAAAGGAGAPAAAAVGGAGAAPEEAASPAPALAHVEEVFVKPATTPESETEVVRRLTELGFSEAMIGGSVGGLSGGWRLKLALARAMMSGSALFLLDEPTNHLDVKNVAWLTDYLENVVEKAGISLMVVSHDSKL